MKCNICGGECGLIHKGVRDTPDVNVFECTNCGTKQLDRVYRRDYENGYNLDKSTLSDEDIIKLQNEFAIDDERRAKYVGSFARGKSLLDFGCGLGGFLIRIDRIPDFAGGWSLAHRKKSILQK